MLHRRPTTQGPSLLGIRLSTASLRHGASAIGDRDPVEHGLAVLGVLVLVGILFARALLPAGPAIGQDAAQPTTQIAAVEQDQSETIDQSDESQPPTTALCRLIRQKCIPG